LRIKEEETPLTLQEQDDDDDEKIMWPYLVTILLSYPTEQGSSAEASQFSASQEIFRILRNPKI